MALLSWALRCRSCAIGGTVQAISQREFLVWARLLRHEGRDRGDALCDSGDPGVWREVKRQDRLALVPDEETGGKRGSEWLAREGLLGRNGVGMLLAEPTGGVVWNANRGAISLRVRILGKAAHVGLQHQGVNAFEGMHRVVTRLEKLKREVEQRRTRCTVGAEQMRSSILMLGGQSGGGSNFNVVPEECWFTIDRRINPEENLDQEKAELLGVLEQCKQEGISLKWEVLQEGSSGACREDEALGQSLSRSVQAVSGEAPCFEMCPGLLETRF